jgi:chromosome partitioning protein
LRLSTHYIIPTIPDIVSTWGIFQIVTSITAFSEDINRRIKPLGIVATKVQANGLHDRIMRQLREGRLFNEQRTDLKQPPLFKNFIKQGVDTARGAEYAAPIHTLHQKYGLNYDSFYGLTTEILAACKT